MAHVDEAVMALAQTLLRRGAPTAAGQVTGTSTGDLPSADRRRCRAAAPSTAPAGTGE